jgi:hypothetical protein
MYFPWNREFSSALLKLWNFGMGGFEPPQTYFPWNREFGSALSKLRNFGGGGCLKTPAWYATALPGHILIHVLTGNANLRNKCTDFVSGA